MLSRVSKVGCSPLEGGVHVVAIESGLGGVRALCARGEPACAESELVWRASR